MSDLISRQEAVKQFCGHCKGQSEPCEHRQSCKTMKVLESLPSAEPKTGPMLAFAMPDLNTTLVRALEFIKGYCDKHARCENGCKLYQDGCILNQRDYSYPCDWDPVTKAIAEKEASK